MIWINMDLTNVQIPLPTWRSFCVRNETLSSNCSIVMISQSVPNIFQILRMFLARILPKTVSRIKNSYVLQESILCILLNVKTTRSFFKCCLLWIVQLYWVEYGRITELCFIRYRRYYSNQDWYYQNGDWSGSVSTILSNLSYRRHCVEC